MIGNWLKRKTQLAVVKSGREDLERFVSSLRGFTDEELGLLVANATIIRLRLIAAGEIPPEVLDSVSSAGDGASFVQLKIANLVRTFQKIDQLSDAAATMVWLHTIRALGIPEIRELGREMWAQLSRGFPHAENALDDIEAITQKELPAEAWEACTFVPDGLALPQMLAQRQGSASKVADRR
jgi:hypothetical protein